MNPLGIDYEDWLCDVEGVCPSRHTREVFVRQHHAVLKHLAAHGVRATFFFLGRTVERHPDLVQEIANAGHEVGCHGFGHEKLTAVNQQQFAADLRRATVLLEEVTGIRPVGYRAPYLSVGPREAEFLYETLADQGYCYSSSVLPLGNRSRGLADHPRAPKEVACTQGSVWEFPLAVLEGCSWRVPVAGGGFWRMAPRQIVLWALNSHEAQGLPFAVYVHPHEFDPQPLRSPRGSLRDLWVNLGRTRVPVILDWALHTHSFGTFVDLMSTLK